MYNNAPYRVNDKGSIPSRLEDERGRSVCTEAVVRERRCIDENERRRKGEPAPRMDCVEDQTTGDCHDTCDGLD